MMRARRGSGRLGTAILLVVALGVCLLAAAGAAPSTPPVCLAMKGEELSASKSPVPVLLATLVVADPVVQARPPGTSALPERRTFRAPAVVPGDLAPRAPPVQP